MSVVNDFLDRNGRFIVFALVCALVAYGYEIFSYTISIDDEVHFHDTAVQLARHLIGQGRWGTGLLAILFGNSCGVPVVPMLESLLCISIVFHILGRFMRFGADERFMFYPICIACPIWYYYLSFWMVSPYGGIGLLLSAVGFLGFMQRNPWVRLAALVPGAMAVGIYEISIVLLPIFCSAYVLGDIVSGEGAGSHDARTGSRWRGYLALFLKTFVFMLVCVALYYGIGKAVRHACGLPLIYTSGMFNPPRSWGDVPGRLRMVFDLAASCYWGNWFLPAPPEHGYLSVHRTFVTLSLVAIAIGILKAKRDAWSKLVAAASLVFLVFAPFMLRFMTVVMPPRSCILVAFSLVVVFCLAWRCVRSIPCFRFLFLALLVLVSIRYLSIVNRLAYASKMQSDRDCEVVRRVVERLEADPSFSPYICGTRGCPFIMVGAPHFGRGGGWPASLRCDTVGRSILDWEGGVPDRFAYLTRLLTGRMLAWPGKEAVQELSPVVDDMPLWPLPGSVVMTNGVAIAKFENDFSPYQLQFYHIADDRRLLFFPRQRGLSEWNPSQSPSGPDSVFSFADSCVKKVVFGEYKGGGVFVSNGPDFQFHTIPIDADADKRYVVDVCYTLESGSAVSSRSEIFYRDSSISWNNGIGEISFVRNKLGENRFAVVMPGRLLRRGLRFDLSERAGETIRIGHLNIFEAVE